MSKPAKALYTKDFLLATIASVFVGGYSILLLTLTLMYGNDAGFTAAAAGLLSSVFAFASLGMRPFSRLLCDRFPKKRLLILSAVGYTVLPLLFLAGLPYGVLLGARIAQGFCMGVASTGRCRDRHLLHPEVPLYGGREHFWRRHVRLLGGRARHRALVLALQATRACFSTALSQDF